MRGYVAWLIAAISVVAALWLFVSPAGLFTGDEGIKLAETQSLAFTHYRDASLYNPGATAGADPFGAYDGFTFTGADGASRYGTYPLLYPALAAPLYRIGGLRGAELLSLASFIVTLLLTARLARRCRLPEPAVAGAVAIVGLGSAMPLYASTLFEHTASVAVLLAAIDTLVGGTSARRMMLAGALFGIATCFRTELYAFTPAFAMIVIWQVRLAWLRWLACAAGALLVLAAFLIVHRLATSAWHPTLTASASGEVLSLFHRFGHIVAYELVGPAQFLVLATGIAGIVRSLFGRWHPAVTVVLAAAWCLATAITIRNVSANGDVRTVTGLFTATPVLALALLGGIERDGTPRGILTLAATCFCATVVLLPKGSANGGLELGARYLLPAVPLFAIGAASYRHRIDRVCGIALLATSMWATVINARAQWQIRGLGEEVLVEIDGNRAQAVFTKTWWVAQLAVPTQADGVRLFVGEKPTAAYDQLYAAGVRRVIALRGKLPLATGHIRPHLVPTLTPADPRLSPRVYELTDSVAWPAR